MLLFDEEKRLFEAIVPDYLKSMVPIFINTGLRRQELLKLTWEDANLKNYQLSTMTNQEEKRSSCLARRPKWARFVPYVTPEDKGRTSLFTKEFPHIYELTCVIDDERIGSGGWI